MTNDDGRLRGAVSSWCGHLGDAEASSWVDLETPGPKERGEVPNGDEPDGDDDRDETDDDWASGLLQRDFWLDYDPRDDDDREDDDETE